MTHRRFGDTSSASSWVTPLQQQADHVRAKKNDQVCLPCAFQCVDNLGLSNSQTHVHISLSHIYCFFIVIFVWIKNEARLHKRAIMLVYKRTWKFTMHGWGEKWSGTNTAKIQYLSKICFKLWSLRLAYLRLEEGLLLSLTSNTAPLSVAG